MGVLCDHAEQPPSRGTRNSARRASQSRGRRRNGPPPGRGHPTGCDGTRCVGAVAVSAVAASIDQLRRQCVDEPLELQSVIHAQTDPVKSILT